MRILVVEDEKRIADDICEAMQRAGYVVEISGDGEDAWFRAETEDFDALVIDLGLPKLDGLTIIRRLRAANVATPVLVLTARSSWSDRVVGIDVGADDYLGKPFHMEELLARVGALVRRSGGHANPVLEAGNVRIDTRRLVVAVEERNVQLSPLEFRALRYLVHHKGRVITHTELSEHVYESEREPDSNAVEVLIGRLRKKIGTEVVLTHRGFGYLVEA